MGSPGRREPPRDPVDDDLATDEQLAAFEAGLARIEARLKAEHPELFDEAGEIRSDEVSRILTKRMGDKTEFTLDEFLAVIGRDGRAPL